ncbi:unnamed protein product [Arabidopsis halleri]
MMHGDVNFQPSHVPVSFRGRVLAGDSLKTFPTRFRVVRNAKQKMET